MTAWERLALFEGGTVTSLAVATTADGRPIVLAGTLVGVFVSTDRGRSWTMVSETPLPDVEVVAPSPRFAEDQALFVGARDGLFRWHADGPTWEHLVTGSRVLSVACLPDPERPLTIFVGTEDDGILVSRDGGRSWDGANPGLLDLTILALAVSPAFADDGLAFAATPSGLYRTRNGAESWRAVRLAWDDVAVQCLALSPGFAEDRVALAGTEERGLLRSDDAGRSWQSVPDLGERSVNSLTWTEGGVVAATDVGLALSHDGGESWGEVGADLGPVLTAHPVRPQAGGGERVLLAGLPSAGIARSTDLGRTWGPANGGLHASLVVGLSLSPGFASDRTMFAASMQGGISVSQDGGETWAERNVGLADTTAMQVVVSPGFAEDRTVYAATGSGLYVSRDGAERWEPVLPDAPPEPASAIAVEGAGRVACIGGRLAASDDAGRTWHDLETPFPDLGVVGLALSPGVAPDRTLYVATAGPSREDGLHELILWRSADGGRTWERWLEERGALPVGIAALPPNPFGDAVAVGIGGRVLRPRPNAQEVRGGIRRPLWSAADLPGRPSAISGLVASPGYERDRTLFAATGPGVYVSRDGGERFALLGDGPNPPAVVAVAPSPAYAEDRVVYALGLGGTIWRVSA